MQLRKAYRSSFVVERSVLQMIREAYKAKRLEFARQYLHVAEGGFTDIETSIKLETHRRFCFPEQHLLT